MRKKLIRSYAKINICLNVVGKRPNGYHDLDMVLLPLELHDSVLFQKLPENAAETCTTIDDFSTMHSDYNTATHAVDMLQLKYGFKDKFRIFIHKVIPIKAGLGGGSSNAAATLFGVSSFLKLNIPKEEMIKIGFGIGCDVPFFIDSKPARCQGLGEIVTPINVKNDYYVLLVKPRGGCSTEDIFQLCDKMELDTGNVDNVIKALEEGDDDLLANSIFNSLEKPAFEIVPEIKTIKEDLLASGLKVVLMSGSGSCVFALSTDKKLLQNKYKEFEQKYYYCELTKVRK